MATFEDDPEVHSTGGEELLPEETLLDEELDEPQQKKGIKPWMIILGGMILMLVVGFMLKSGSHEDQAVAEPVPQITTQPISAAPQVDPQAPVADPALVPTPQPPVPVAATLTPTESAPTIHPEDLDTVKSQVSGLDDRVTELERKLSELSTRKAYKPVTARAVSPGRKSNVVASQKSDTEPKTEAKQDQKPQPDITLNYRIKAIPSTFQDQAWIEDREGKVSIVNVGDVFSGAKVLSVDSDKFEVKTDKGVIR